MNLKRWVMGTLGAFGVLVVSNFVIHEFWLGEFYRLHATWWRPADQMQSLRWALVLSNALLAGFLTLIYAKGYEAGKGTLAQGFRFGVLFGLLLFVPSTLMHYVVYPYPGSLLINWLVGGLLQMALTGVMIGYLYKSE